MPFYAQTDRRFAGLEFKLGAFTILSIVAMVAVAAMAVRRSDFFSPSSALYFYVKSGEGIKEGMPVKLSGFTIGYVKSQDLWEMAKVEKSKSGGLQGLAVKVSLDIKTRYLQWIPRDSQAFLRKENVIGDQIIEMVPGAYAETMKAGDLVKFAKEKALNDYFADISEQVKKVQAEAAKTMDYINDPEGEVRNVLGNLLKFTVGLVETREKITQAFVTMDNTLLTVKDEVHGLGGSANKSIGELNQALGVTNTELPKTFQKIGESLDTAHKALDDVQKLGVVLSKDMPEIMEMGKDVAKEAEELTGSLKKTWPISRNIKPAQTKPLDVDSHETR
jgi:phospholipid/cholesterol/gamma-HCH transport system substrate-binding protein